MTDQFVPDGEAVGEGVEYPAPSAATTDPQPERLQELLAERTADLQRLQAEYVNYKRRVDRDRHVARSRGIEAVVVDLLPVLDSIEAARAHDELNEGAGLIADQIEKVSTKHGLVRYGAVGDPFDPETTVGPLSSIAARSSSLTSTSGGVSRNTLSAMRCMLPSTP